MVENRERSNEQRSDRRAGRNEEGTDIKGEDVLQGMGKELSKEESSESSERE